MTYAPLCFLKEPVRLSVSPVSHMLCPSYKMEMIINLVGQTVLIIP